MKMKTTITVCGAAVLLFAAIQSRAEIIAGPVTNPANGHDYYLLAPESWPAAEAEAENLGGTLAIIKNAADQEWVFSKFGDYAGTNRTLWIGLHRSGPDRTLAWVTSEKLEYSNWGEGQPDDAGRNESCVLIASANRPFGLPPGRWNDYLDYGQVDGSAPYGVVEVPGKSNEKSLTGKEKELIGTWYASGNRDHPCWIAGTDNKLFQIYDGRAVRLIFTAEGPLFLANRIRGELVKDKILWSNGTWWSQKPVTYGKEVKLSDKDADTNSADAQK